MLKMIKNLCLCCLVIVTPQQTCWGLSTSAVRNAAADFVNIVGLDGGITQSLPMGYVRKFERWVCTDDAQIVKEDMMSCKSSKNIKIRNTKSEHRNQVLQVRPTLDLLLKGGTPTYIMAGLAVQGQEEETTHLRPLARQWTTFGLTVDPRFRFEAFVVDSGLLDNDSSVDGDSNDDNIDESEYIPLFVDGGNSDPSDQMKEALQSLGIMISQLDDESPLCRGFHIVSFPLAHQWVDLPLGTYRMVCYATSEPDAQALLDMDSDLVEMTASSILELNVVNNDNVDTRDNGDESLGLIEDTAWQ